MEKISGPAVSPGGMVTGQINTCITVYRRSVCNGFQTQSKLSKDKGKCVHRKHTYIYIYSKDIYIYLYLYVYFVYKCIAKISQWVPQFLMANQIAPFISGATLLTP